MTSISLSRYLAIVLGVLTPLGETIRRWSTWRDDPAAFFDDYILGGLLLYGAWQVGRDARAGQRFLAAGWAFMCGWPTAVFSSNYTISASAQLIRRPFHRRGWLSLKVSDSRSEC